MAVLMVMGLVLVVLVMVVVDGVQGLISSPFGDDVGRLNRTLRGVGVCGLLPELLLPGECDSGGRATAR
jgi:hypothetical protein